MKVLRDTATGVILFLRWLAVAFVVIPAAWWAVIAPILLFSGHSLDAFAVVAWIASVAVVSVALAFVPPTDPTL
jgi:hypothetical protein